MGDKAAEDEAVVHNKHATVIVRKMPLPKPDLGDSSGSSATKAAPAVATKKAAVDDDLFDDDFADIPSAATVGAAAAASATATAAATGGPEEDGEEVAVFDLSNADWWFGQLAATPARGVAVCVVICRRTCFSHC
jgi:hypothetical protein